MGQQNPPAAQAVGGFLCVSVAEAFRYGSQLDGGGAVGTSRAAARRTSSPVVANQGSPLLPGGFRPRLIRVRRFAAIWPPRFARRFFLSSLSSLSSLFAASLRSARYDPQKAQNTPKAHRCDRQKKRPALLMRRGSPPTSSPDGGGAVGTGAQKRSLRSQVS